MIDTARRVADSRTGTLGSALLLGLLSTHQGKTPQKPSNGWIRQEQRNSFVDGDTHGLLDDEQDLKKPTRFIACVQTSDSAQRLRKEMAQQRRPPPVTIVQAPRPGLLHCEPGVRKAMQGKLLISILDGMTIPEIEEVLDPSKATKPSAKVNGASRFNGNTHPTSIVRAMPNTASEDAEQREEEILWGPTAGMAPENAKAPMAVVMTPQPYASIKAPANTGPKRVAAAIAQLNKAKA
ncbi:MAG: hypothetical protein Q9208_007628 [Pyrenodesmia sp. 3 TL-2023]